VSDIGHDQTCNLNAKATGPMEDYMVSLSGNHLLGAGISTASMLFIPLLLVKMIVLLGVGFSILFHGDSSLSSVMEMKWDAMNTLCFVVLISLCFTLNIFITAVSHAIQSREPFVIFKSGHLRSRTAFMFVRIFFIIVTLFFTLITVDPIIYSHALFLSVVLIASEYVWLTLMAVVRHRYAVQGVNVYFSEKSEHLHRKKKGEGGGLPGAFVLGKEHLEGIK
jgi:hypothetical protein